MSDACEPKLEVCNNPDIYHCCKICAMNRQTRYLPQDILFDIFLHLPARVLQDLTRHVCREWDLVTRNPSFIRRHLRNSTSGIIIQKVLWEHEHQSEVYVEMRGGCVEISKFDCGFRGRILTSCNGLLLAPPHLKDSRILYVINPLTKQRLFLARYFSDIRSHRQFGLAFVEASMEYKVVHLIERARTDLSKHVAVLTVGVDKVWRRIDIRHLSLKTRRAFRFVSPMVTGGYVHWIRSCFGLTLNVETETFRRFTVPRINETCKTFLPMGDSLTVVCGDFLREVWEMNPRTGKWIMLLTFDLEPLGPIFEDDIAKNFTRLVPFGWLKVREVLLFSSYGFQRRFAAYNIKTREIHGEPFELDSETTFPSMQYYILESHVNSLIRLEG